MKKFEQFGTPLTRSEAKEIRGGMYNIGKPVRDNEDPGSGSGDPRDCSWRNPCAGSCHVGGAGPGTCHEIGSRCVCLTPG